MAFDKLVKEIDFTFNLIIFFFVFLRTCIVFLISFLIISVFIPQWWLAFIPAIIFYIRDSKSKKKLNNMREIENRYPELKDKLRTATDNLDEGNIFIFDLHKEVLEMIKSVNSSTFFNKRRAKNDLVVLSILAIITILIAPWNIHIFNLSLDPQSLANLDFKELWNKNKKNFGIESTEEGGLGENEDIYGKKSVANLGNKEIELTLSSDGTDISIKEVKPPEDLEFEAIYPEDLGAVASASFEEQIKQEHQELVKEYYTRIAKG